MIRVRVKPDPAETHGEEEHTQDPSEAVQAEPGNKDLMSDPHIISPMPLALQ